jgi:hypothetical protein
MGANNFVWYELVTGNMAAAIIEARDPRGAMFGLVGRRG